MLFGNSKTREMFKKVKVRYNSSKNLLDRFIEEQEYVLRFTELLQRKLSLDTGDIYEIINALDKYNLIDKTVLPKDYHKHINSHDSDELRHLLHILRDLKPIIQAEVIKTEKIISKIKYPENFSVVSGNSLTGECINFLLGEFGENPSKELVNNLRLQLKQNLENVEKEPVFITNKKGTFDELIDYSVDAALYIIPTRKFNNLRESLYDIEDVEIAGRLSRSDTEINPLRQGFITLTTIFDATIFDLMKLALSRDFFNLVSLFGKQDKISLDKLSQFSSFEDFRNEIIEEQLKSKYLKEILITLNLKGVILTDSTKGDEFIHLIEMVLRRNIHIHNRGVVDYKYLELNDKGKPRYNIYNFKEESFASIDFQYWEKINRLCLNCVKSISHWVETLPN